MKRPTATGGAGKGDRSWSCPDAWIFEAYPLLAAGLCDPWWDDGKPRDCWTLKFSYSGPSCQVILNDSGGKLVAFTVSTSLEDAFHAIEVALEAGTLAWRKSKW